MNGDMPYTVPRVAACAADEGAVLVLSGAVDVELLGVLPFRIQYRGGVHPPSAGVSLPVIPSVGVCELYFKVNTTLAKTTPIRRLSQVA